MSDHLIAPHGGSLVNLIVDAERAAELKAAAADWPSWDLTPRQICDLDLLLSVQTVRNAKENLKLQEESLRLTTELLRGGRR